MVTDFSTVQLPASLVDAFAKGSCVVVIGSGISTAATGGRIQGWDDFVKGLSSELRTEGLVEDEIEDPLLVAEIYKYYKKGTFFDKVQEKYRLPDYEYDLTLYRLLSQLPTQIFITTNWDPLLENSFAKLAIPYHLDVQGNNLSTWPQRELPLIEKIHGTYDNPDTIVATQTDYAIYHQKFDTAYGVLKGELTKSSFFYLGFGMRDPNFVRLHLEVRYRLGEDKMRLSYALVTKPKPHERDLWRSRNVEFIDCKEYSNLPIYLDELVRRSQIEREKRTVAMAIKQRGSIRSLVETQKAYLENRPLLAQTFTDRESVAFLFPDVFVDPPISLSKNPRPQFAHLGDWLSSEFREGSKFIVTGVPGIGKSTALIQVYLQYAKEFLAGRSNVVPLFVEMRSIQLTNLSDPAGVLHALGNAHGLKLPMPRDTLTSGYAFLLLVDGLDEFFVAPTKEQVEDLLGKLSQCWHVVSCRRDFFDKYLADSQSLSRYTEIVELGEWTPECQVSQFIGNYFRKVTPREGRGMTEFQEFLDSRPEITSILRTPLFLTMILFVWRYAEQPRQLRLETLTDLYDVFLDLWMDREVRRGSAVVKDTESLRALMESAAWLLYGEMRGVEIDLTEFATRVCQETGIHVERLEADTAFASFLKLRRSYRGKYSRLMMTSFLHESFLEFFVSKRVIRSLLYDKPLLETVLHLTFLYSVNVFVRESLNPLDNKRKAEISERLLALYNKHSGVTVLESVVIRNGAAYYLGRLDTESAKTSLAQIYWRIKRGELAEHPMVKGTIASGLILMCDTGVEKDYLASLANDSPDDTRNRKYHLVYYGDAPDEGPDGYLRDEPAPGRDDWAKTRRAFVRRLKSSGKRELQLRAYDLATFRRLCETRRYLCLSAQEKVAVDTAIKHIDVVGPNKKALTLDQYRKLKIVLGSGKT